LIIDKFKLALALVILLAGMVAYYQLQSWTGSEVSILIRVGVALVSGVIAIAIAASSKYGLSLIEFAKGSRIELRKMVWPTRPETIQTTVIVLVMVVLVALFLWLVDASVFQIIYDWILGIDS